MAVVDKIGGFGPVTMALAVGVLGMPNSWAAQGGHGLPLSLAGDGKNHSRSNARTMV